MTNYAIDANILINLHIFAAQEYHPQFWSRLADMVNQGRVVIIQDIAQECRDKPLKEWLKQVKVTKIDQATALRAVAINNQYPIITVVNGQIKSKADPRLIACAQAKSLHVLTYEQGRRHPRQPYKIPDVCQKLNIPCERFISKAMKTLKLKGCQQVPAEPEFTLIE